MAVYLRRIQSDYIREKRTGIFNEGCWTAVLKYMGIYVFAQLVIPCIAMIILPVFESSDLERVTAVYQEHVLWFLLISQVITVLIYRLNLHGKGKTLWEHLGLWKWCELSAKARHIPADILIGIGMYLFIQILFWMVGADTEYAGSPGYLQEIIGGSHWGIVVLVTAVTSPAIEELLFRGLIQKELERRMQTAGAIISQALLFGIFHLHPVQSAYAFICGLILGYVCKRKKSVMDGILVHIVFNSLGIWGGR